MPYPGGKAGPGVYQTLINQIPPHHVYVAAFGGHDAVLQYKRPAGRNILIDLEAATLDWWARAAREDVELFHCDAIDWLEHQFRLARYRAAGSGVEYGDPTRWFVYLDPPYPMATRTSGPMYRHEMTDAQHERLLATAMELPAMVMISSYPNDLYQDTLASWRSLDFQSVCRSGEKRTERIWMNYPEPTELHDYRFLGSNKRERERIRKRCRNWSQELCRLDPLERGAILQAISERLAT